MTVFENYAKYYDKFYNDKDYSSETQYLVELIHDHMKSASSILDVGCGTGLHALEFAKRGFRVHGVDRSPRMISCAEDMRDSLSAELKSRLTFSVGDLTSLRTGEKYDVVTSIFHVMSYQTTQAEVENAFASVSRHTRLEGLFVFDFWFGPAVLGQRPEVRVKIVEDSEKKIIRIAIPSLATRENCVDICFDFIELNKDLKSYREFSEVHTMRYFFRPELEAWLCMNDFSLTGFYEWLTRNQPSERSWSVCVVAKSGLGDSSK